MTPASQAGMLPLHHTHHVVGPEENDSTCYQLPFLLVMSQSGYGPVILISKMFDLNDSSSFQGRYATGLQHILEIKESLLYGEALYRYDTIE